MNWYDHIKLRNGGLISQVSRERKEVAKQLSIWGEECDDDVSDVTDKLGVLIYEIGELEDNFIGI